MRPARPAKGESALHRPDAPAQPVRNRQKRKTFEKHKKPLTSRRIYDILLELALGKDPGSTAMMREIAALPVTSAEYVR